ncbi:carboxymuconolactone decarboxylase family protein [Methylococcus sp. ANG]|uniref:carboxymuconolactone decarboxylase family protein n=1 Tax=Methylococcus sp. ANG TaxID=3231903 RepID=UPI00345ADAE2
MSRITTVSNESANTEQRSLLEAIQSQLGMVPNFLRVFAHSPDALKAFLGLHHIAGHGSLDAATRERIALALAQKNECEYCLEGAQGSRAKRASATTPAKP